MVDCNESDYTRPGVEFEHVCNKVGAKVLGWLEDKYIVELVNNPLGYFRESEFI